MRRLTRLLAAVLVFASAAGAARAATLHVANNTDAYVTVSVDGGYGCNTAAHTTCTIPVSEGPHELHAVREDDKSTWSGSTHIGAGGVTLTLTGSLMGALTGDTRGGSARGAAPAGDTAAPRSAAPPGGMAPAAPAGGSGRIVLSNETNVTVTMLVDGGAGCTAGPGSTCSTTAAAGSHVLTASAERGSVGAMPMTLAPGGSWTWRVVGKVGP